MLVLTNIGKQISKPNFFLIFFREKGKTGFIPVKSMAGGIELRSDRRKQPGKYCSGPEYTPNRILQLSRREVWKHPVKDKIYICSKAKFELKW